MKYFSFNKRLFLSLIGFFVLNIYFNFLPTILPHNDILRFFHLLFFFPIAYLVAQKLTNKGLDFYGVIFFKGWLRNLTLGFSIGFISWSVLFGLYFYFGKYQFIGFIPFMDSAANLVIVLIGFGIGSLINDMIVRGYVINGLKGKIPSSYIFLLSVLIYTFDDIWNAGFSLQNTIFSFILGLSLTYAFFKANSIWVNTGIHFGLNVLYGLFFGVSQQVGGGLFLFKEQPAAEGMTPWLSTIISAVILLILLGLRRQIVVYQPINKYKSNVSKESNSVFKF